MYIPPYPPPFLSYAQYTSPYLYFEWMSHPFCLRPIVHLLTSTSIGTANVAVHLHVSIEITFENRRKHYSVEDFQITVSSVSIPWCHTFLCVHSLHRRRTRVQFSSIWNSFVHVTKRVPYQTQLYTCTIEFHMKLVCTRGQTRSNRNFLRTRVQLSSIWNSFVHVYNWVWYGTRLYTCTIQFHMKLVCTRGQLSSIWNSIVHMTY